MFFICFLGSSSNKNSSYCSYQRITVDALAYGSWYLQWTIHPLPSLGLRGSFWIGEPLDWAEGNPSPLVFALIEWEMNAMYRCCLGDVCSKSTLEKSVVLFLFDGKGHRVFWHAELLEEAAAKDFVSLESPIMTWSENSVFLAIISLALFLKIMTNILPLFYIKKKKLHSHKDF